VDLTVRYYHGPRRPGVMQFTGPFAPDKPVTADGDPSSRVVFPSKSLWGDRAAEFRFTTPRPFGSDMPVLVYDTLGQRHLADRGSGSSGGAGADYTYRVEGVSANTVESVVFGEPPRERTFQGIPVRFAVRPPRSHAKWLDELAARLGRPPQDAAGLDRYRPASPREAMSVIDLVPAKLGPNYLQTIQHGGPRLRPADLTPEELQRLRATAERWVKDPIGGPCGAMLGLWGEQADFVDPALDLIAKGGPAGGEVSYLLQNRTELLTAAHRERIKNILLTSADRRTTQQLFNMLFHPAGAAGAEEARVEIAQSAKTGLWWVAIERLGGDRRQPGWQRLVEQAEQDSRMRRRLLQARGADAVPDPSPKALAEAAAGLPGLLNVELLRDQPETFTTICQAIEKRTEPAAATPVLIAFLRALRDDPEATRSESFASPNDYAVLRIARMLNQWHGIDIGGIGGPDDGANDIAVDWRVLATQAIRWAETGQDPAKLPAAWKPAPGDLRIVFRNLDAPELSMIGVAEKAPADGPSWRLMLLVRDFVNYNVLAHEGGYTLNLRVGQIHSNGGSYAFGLTPADLPKKLPIGPELENTYGTDATGRRIASRRWGGRWEIWVEAIDAEPSALAGTELFAAWQRAYLPGPASEPLSRVYHRHTREAIRDMLIARRDASPKDPAEGWTPAQVALQETIHQDPRHIGEVLRPYADPIPSEVTQAAWERFLGRDDLTPEMKVTAWWHLGHTQPRDGMTDSERNADRARRAEAFGKAWKVDPE
jgi:hypothetical protein